MSRSNIPSADGLRGELVVDADGQQIGNILGVYLDNDTRQPEWVAVRLPSGNEEPPSSAGTAS